MPNEQRHLEVFLCHAHSNQDAVRELYRCLTRDGVHAWLDKERLLPGQDWELEIRKAVRAADVVIICLSMQFDQAGFRQKEMRLVLDAAMEKPDGEIFIIPLRLEECDVPQSLQRWQWVDLFEKDGYDKLLRALQKRAEDIGVVLQIQKSWLPRNTAPRLNKKEHPAAFSNNQPGGGTEQGKLKQERNYKSGAAKVPAKSGAPKSSSKTNPAIVAAAIGAVGTIAAALITLYANLPISLTETPTPTVTLTTTATNTASPTFTLAPSEPTFTALPATDTPIPTFTPVPPVALGQDWIAGCISTLWKPYPSDVPVTDRQNGCWQEPVHVFSAENGDLDFLAEIKK
ncbi:MAG: toll/interleukin-1 receptor domain-containing protein, partial [Chloroflexota bacterium]|nr:toll/interleukin-1 receptor domain-containing protein [Anaerolineales bacterium]